MSGAEQGSSAGACEACLGGSSGAALTACRPVKVMSSTKRRATQLINLLGPSMEGELPHGPLILGFRHRQKTDRLASIAFCKARIRRKNTRRYDGSEKAEKQVCATSNHCMFHVNCVAVLNVAW
jgi:hypothetical protein